jgi:predicted metal-dependent phosphoesterase TrpH
MKKADLHLHTNRSDGQFSVEDLIKLAKSAELDIISITDHDTIDSVEEAIEIGKFYGIEVIPGLEISTEFLDIEIHILAYFFDVTSKELEEYLSFFRAERYKRALRIIQKLNSIGLSISIDDVLEVASNSTIGRPHIAKAMVKNNLVSNYQEAFNKYIGNGCIAFERKVHLSPQSACKIINDAGGLSFIAHPNNMSEDIIKILIDSGIDGIEVIHPSHLPHKIEFFRGIVSEYFLLESGGSDFHGGERNDLSNLGKYFIQGSKVDAMRNYLIKNRA